MVEFRVVESLDRDNELRTHCAFLLPDVSVRGGRPALRQETEDSFENIFYETSLFAQVRQPRLTPLTLPWPPPLGWVPGLG